MRAAETHHRYSRADVDWGFTSFINKNAFYTEEAGKRFIVDDAFTISVTILVMADEYGTLWNTFKEYVIWKKRMVLALLSCLSIDGHCECDVECVCFCVFVCVFVYFYGVFVCFTVFLCAFCAFYE